MPLVCGLKSSFLPSFLAGFLTALLEEGLLDQEQALAVILDRVFF